MAGDLKRVAAELTSSARSQDAYLTEITSHLVAAGGKLIRPGFCIAAAATTHAKDMRATPEVIRGAAAVELVHLGSLYHDDVMDDATTRHFVASVNSRWGNHRAILAGDFLLARASEIAASLGVEVAGLLAATITRLCEGQVLELQHLFEPDRSEDDYLRSINGKTAALLATACRIGGIVADLPPVQLEAVTTFGHSYGMAFQIVDDVLDLVSTDAALGKPAGHDMEEGVYTLPVIRALKGNQGDELRSLLVTPMTETQRQRAVELVRNGGHVEGAIEVARGFADTAASMLDDFNPGPGVDGFTAAAAHLVSSVETAAA